MANDDDCGEEAADDPDGAVVFGVPIPTGTSGAQSSMSSTPLIALRDDDTIEPVLRLTRKLGKRSLTFEGLIQGAYGLCLVDSGASRSFVSLAYCEDNGLRVSGTTGAGVLADGRPLPLSAIIRKAHLKLGPFRTKLDLIVADLPGLDVVLGMDFLNEHDPQIQWKRREMTLMHADRPVLITAHREQPELPDLQSDLLELCTIQDFSRELSRVDAQDVLLGFVRPEQEVSPGPSEPAPPGVGADDPRVASLLADFTDVLVQQMPPGLPPERFAADGRPIEHVIETAPDVKPYAANPRPFARAEDAEIRKQLGTLLASGWINPSLSPWASPVLFVRKKPDPVTGVRGYRMCISYVKLNAKTLNRIAYRLPRIADLLDRIGSATYFSKLDLLSGYYQVRMRPGDVEKTAFCTPYGNFEFRVMPFGLNGAPSTFMYMMDEVFRKAAQLPAGREQAFTEFVAVYLDDVCIFSNTIAEHLLHLRAVLQRLREYKLYCKPSKCEWLRTEVEFLGHVVSGEGRAVQKAKADALQSWPEPRNVPELRSLLGTFGFWREYIEHYADIVDPLVELTLKDTSWRWGTTERHAFATLKCALAAAPVLAHVNTGHPFIVVTDASDFAVGGSLEQIMQDGRQRPVAYFSHRLSKAERNYPVHERELLAIVLALRTWRHYLLGSDFTVFCKTDHRPIQDFMGQDSLSGPASALARFLV